LVIAIPPATYGETIEVHTSIVEWRNKTFTQRHVVKRGDTVLCEGTEVRAFCIKDPDQSGRIKAIPVPAFIREACS
jgi:4-hydroxybenzoyl-CoA thioesterase